MAKPTIPYQKITANPSRLVDCPPASDRTRLAAPHKVEEGQADMQMMHANQFQPAHELDAAEVLSLSVPLGRPAPTAAWIAAATGWQLSDAARKIYVKETWGPAWDATINARVADEQKLQSQIATIPHFTTEISYESSDGEAVHMTTANDLDIRAAMSGATGADDDNFRRCCRDLIRGIGARFAAEQEIREQFEFGPGRQIDPTIEAEMDRLDGIAQEAWDVLVKFPAGTPGDLLAKTEFLQSLDVEVDHAELMIDILRIWGGAPSMPDRTAAYWQEAMRAYVAAKAASDSDNDSPQAANLCDLMVEAEDRLREAAAPDLAAVEWKIISLQKLAEDIILEPSALNSVLADVRRLSASPAEPRLCHRASADGNLSERYHRLFDELAAHPFGSTSPSDPQFQTVDADHSAKNRDLERAYSEMLEAPVRNGHDLALKLEAVIRHYDGASIPEEDMRSMAADARALG